MRAMDRLGRTGKCVLCAVAPLFITTYCIAAVDGDSPPNLLLIVADDMGYSDLGCYGGEIKTPHLDSLANNGLRYSQFYNSGRCWPTRAALLTGYYAQQVNRDTLPSSNGSGFNRQRPDWAPLVSEILRDGGYRCYHSGKWHIDGSPSSNGFERSYLIETCERFFYPKNNFLDDKRVPQKTLDDNYYATTAIADYAIEFLQEHQQHHPKKPFFEYVAFTAPHFPLHAPAADIARYQGQYNVGWDAIRSDRWARLQDLQIVPGKLSQLEASIGPPYHFPESLEQLGEVEITREEPWKSLTTDQKSFQAIKMEIHAAMIDRMDQEIGRILDQLRNTGEYDNTVIVFLSDNGASAEIMIRGDGHDPMSPPGSAESYLCLGPGWSKASNTPFRRHKTWVHEGGISTPLIVHWPSGLTGSGEWREGVGHVIDIVPTLLEIAGLDVKKIFGATEKPTIHGKSLLGSFDTDIPIEREALWWLHEGNRAIRSGNWKLVAAKGDSWELYDLSKDRSETNDVASEMPAKVSQLSNLWNQYTALFQSDLVDDQVLSKRDPMSKESKKN